MTEDEIKKRCMKVNLLGSIPNGIACTYADVVLKVPFGWMLTYMLTLGALWIYLVLRPYERKLRDTSKLKGVIR